MNFSDALDALIADALAAEDGYSVQDIVFELGQAELSLRLTVLQADDEEAEGKGDADAE